jgi:hypothetical protein
MNSRRKLFQLSSRHILKSSKYNKTGRTTYSSCQNKPNVCKWYKRKQTVKLWTGTRQGHTASICDIILHTSFLLKSSEDIKLTHLSIINKFWCLQIFMSIQHTQCNMHWISHLCYHEKKVSNSQLTFLKQFTAAEWNMQWNNHYYMYYVTNCQM